MELCEWVMSLDMMYGPDLCVASATEEVEGFWYCPLHAARAREELDAV